MENKQKSILLYVVSIVFYVVATIYYFSDDSSSGVIWIALGSSFLCLATVNQKNNQK